MEKLNKNVTLLINTSDNYIDAWPPFFKLLKKYWDISGIDIVLNTESKRDLNNDLNITYSHCSSKKYGERMLKALKLVKTKYVIYMLEDFFLRNPVDNKRINEIIDFMEKNKNVVCFNSECVQTIPNSIKSNFGGYKVIPNGTLYILNFQVCIWKKEKLIKYIRKNLTPWEWEMYAGILTYGKKDIFYCRDNAPLLFDYGNYKYGDLFGIRQGKWIYSDVKPLFDKENISVDFNKRGIYDKDKYFVLENFKTKYKFWFQNIYHCLGIKHVIYYFLVRLYLKRKNIDYLTFIQRRINNKTKNKFTT